MNRPPAEALTRLLVGTALLLRPQRAAPVLGLQPTGEHLVLRLLGARQVVQGAVISRGPGQTGRTVSAAVDGLHAASCLALAWWHPQLRTPALRNAGLATGFATWALVGAARSTNSHDAGVPS